jgi:phage antirepressor YoqD-like protein
MSSMSSSSASSLWQDQVFRICNELMRHNPPASYADMLQQAEDIHFRQLTQQIELEANRTSAAIAATPVHVPLSND